MGREDNEKLALDRAAEAFGAETESEETTGATEEGAEGVESEKEQTKETKSKESEEDESGKESEESKKFTRNAPQRSTKEDEEEKHKPSKAEKALFQQVNGLEAKFTDAMSKISTALERLAEKPTDKKEEVAIDAVDDAIESLAKKAEAKGSDPDFIRELGKTLKASILSEVKKSGAELSPEIKEKLKMLDELQVTTKKTKEEEHFKQEWSELIPSIKKSFPSMSDAMLEEAKVLMDKLAHSEQFHKYPLDYILFKKSKDFETLLKTAPKKRGAETSRTITTPEEDTEEELDFDDLTPDKIKQMESRIRDDKSVFSKDHQVFRPK